MAKPETESLPTPLENLAGTIPGLSGKTVDMIIPQTEQNKTGVPGCINGIAFNIPRGQRVTVPVEVLGVLNDANVPQMKADGTVIGSVNRFNPQVLAA